MSMGNARRVIRVKTFQADGENTAPLFVPPENGQFRAASMWYTSPGAGTIKAYPARSKIRANADVAASLTLVVDTDSAGKVDGAVLTDSDWVLVNDSSGTGWQARSISAVAAVSSGTVSLTLNASIICAEDDMIHIVRAADIKTVTVAAETEKQVENAFSGIGLGALYIILAATGTCQLTIDAEYEAL